MHNHIDQYCERLGPAFWAEPVNALTNLAFFIAALAAYRLAKREGALSLDVLLLIFLTVCIGLGSALFHTYATVWAMLTDVIPILLFQLVFLGIYSRKVMYLSFARTGLLFAGFIALTVFFFGALPRAWLNGSLGYASTLIFLTGLGIYHVRTQRLEKWTLLATAGLLLASLTFRTLDMLLCPVLPLGTHFMWHILNGMVLYLAMRVIIFSNKTTE